MRGADRRRAILELLNEQGSLSLADIVTGFGVSKMTVHRDLDLLEKRQALKRIHGGAVAVSNAQEVVPQAGLAPPPGQSHCSICHRSVGQHLLYSLTLVNGHQHHYCCPHCGVSAQLVASDKIAMALATDFLNERPHPAQQSWFVLGSVVIPCCRPSMLTFEDELMAKRFQRGFGGVIGRLADALEYLRSEMSLQQGGDGCPHCLAGPPGNPGKAE
jgi:Fe2+ or Zn2+ uptake regulation protein